MTWIQRKTPPEAPLEATHFVLEPLCERHVNADYRAVMANRRMLRLWSGNGDWPEDGFLPQENLRDVVRHHREHLAGEAFTYTVLNPSRQGVMGCVYLVPHPNSDDSTAFLRFWTIDPWVRNGQDGVLARELDSWLRLEWGFRSVQVHVFEEHLQQVNLLQSLGWTEQPSVLLQERGGRYRVFTASS